MSARTARLDEVCEINPRAPKNINDDTVVSFLPMSAVSEDGYVAYEEARIYREVKKGYTYFERGDVLVAKITPCFENGKAASTETIQNKLGFGSTEFHVLRPSLALDPKYAFHLLWSERFRKIGEKGMTGSAGQKRVPADLLKRLEIPLPILGEQKRIAAILDKADHMRQKRRQAITLLDSLTQSIFLEMFGDPVSNPKGWRSEALGDVLSDIESGWSPSCLDRPALDHEWGVLKLSAVTSGVFREAEQKALPSELRPRPKIEIQAGDVLFTRKNTYDLVAACALVGNVRSKLMLSDLIFRLVVRDQEQLSPTYLWACLSNRRLRSQIQSLAGGSAGSMPNISKEKLRGVLIPVPDGESQRSFQAKAMATIAQKKRQLLGLAEAETLFSSLQHRAFTGQL
ncbi:restriction endonuclease subunit S [Shinella sp. M27]|uniref:restriction endonuclease subunit S n=1 Tax=Shinella sp. M27 TaxID=3368614 RepID=UPI003BA1F52A